MHTIFYRTCFFWFDWQFFPKINTHLYARSQYNSQKLIYQYFLPFAFNCQFCSYWYLVPIDSFFFVQRFVLFFRFIFICAIANIRNSIIMFRARTQKYQNEFSKQKKVGCSSCCFSFKIRCHIFITMRWYFTSDSLFCVFCLLRWLSLLRVHSGDSAPHCPEY